MTRTFQPQLFCTNWRSIVSTDMSSIFHDFSPRSLGSSFFACQYNNFYFQELLPCFLGEATVVLQSYCLVNQLCVYIICMSFVFFCQSARICHWIFRERFAHKIMIVAILTENHSHTVDVSCVEGNSSLYYYWGESNKLVNVTLLTSSHSTNACFTRSESRLCVRRNTTVCAKG